MRSFVKVELVQCIELVCIQLYASSQKHDYKTNILENLPFGLDGENDLWGEVCITIDIGISGDMNHVSP